MPDVPASPADARPKRGLLGQLVDDVACRKPHPVLGAVAPATTATAADRPAMGPTPAARTLEFFKRTWSRLSADQRLAQSRATLPDNAGPLNSQHLVHRSLVLMRDLSPEYLEHFVGYIDALQWVEQSNEAEERAVGTPRRSAALKRG
jgi:hypothetical protein